MKNLVLIATTAAVLSSALLASGAAQANGFAKYKQSSIGNGVAQTNPSKGAKFGCIGVSWGCIGIQWTPQQRAKAFGKGQLINPETINPKLIGPGKSGQLITPNK